MPGFGQRTVLLALSHQIFPMRDPSCRHDPPRAPWAHARIVVAQPLPVPPMTLLPVARATFIVAALFVLTSCATRPAPGISGRWKPVNHFADAPDEIPLQRGYVFLASPLDGTLKTLLARWAADSKMTLDYRHPSDFSLYEPVAAIRTGDLQQAVVALTALYRQQRVLVVVSGNAIVVRQIDAAPVPSLPGGTAAAP